MFEHLPIISKDNLKMVAEKEVDYFQDLLSRCTDETNTPDDAIDCMCRELNELNPHLVKAVRGCVYGIAGVLEDKVEPGREWEAGVASVPGVLAVLRLIDRALEAQKLEAQLLQQDIPFPER